MEKGALSRPYSGSPLSPHTLAELAEKLAGLALTPADLEAMGAELAALLDDVHVLDQLDLDEVEPETLFDMQGP
jgi:Asp-tRNA(Asn)/Glu-tRNA(Gln) amidotransferase C subunit